MIKGRLVYMVLIYTLLLGCSSKGNQGNRDNAADAEKALPSLKRYQEVKEKLFDGGFQEMLRSKGIGTDQWFHNDYETLQDGNLYVNHYYNLTIDFPDEMQTNRGVNEFSLIRALVSDYGITITLSVIPVTVNMGENSTPNPSIEYYRSTLRSGFGIEPEDMKLESVPIGKYKFAGVSYRILQHFPSGNPYYMRTATLNLSMFYNTYSVSYSAPDNIFDMELLVQVLNTFQVINPQWSTKN